jgi:hypothetical protein
LLLESPRWGHSATRPTRGVGVTRAKQPPGAWGILGRTGRFLPGSARFLAPSAADPTSEDSWSSAAESNTGASQVLIPDQRVARRTAEIGPTTLWQAIRQVGATVCQELSHRLGRPSRNDPVPPVHYLGPAARAATPDRKLVRTRMRNRTPPTWLLFATVGLVLTLRRPANRSAGRPLPPAAHLAALAGDALWTVGLTLAITLPLLLLPDGRLRSRRWRLVVAASVAGTTMEVVGWILSILASATGGPSSPAIRMRVTPTVLRAKLSPAMPLSPGVSRQERWRGAVSEPGHAAPASQRPYRPANWPPRASSWSGGPASTTRPSSITAIWSASITVESRWAITMVVRP